MRQVPALPGLRPLKRRLAIRAQEVFRFLPRAARDRTSLSELAQLLVDTGIMFDLGEATWFVVRAFERGELAKGSAQLIHDGGVQDLLPEDLVPLKKQRREGSPDYVRGGGGEFTWDSTERLRDNLLQFIYVPLDAVERWFTLRGWKSIGCLMPAGATPRAVSVADATNDEASALGLQADAEPLRPAPAAQIHWAISRVYTHAKAFGMKPPNLKEIARHVRQLLMRGGQTASASRVQQLAGEPRYQRQRLIRGPRVYGRLLPFSLPEI
jgi:hypothetical protein